MRPPITQRCLKTVFFFDEKHFTKTEFYFGGLDLLYRRPEMEYPSHEIEKGNFRVSQGTEIRTKNKESFQSKVLKQNCIAVAVAVVVS